MFIIHLSQNNNKKKPNNKVISGMQAKTYVEHNLFLVNLYILAMLSILVVKS